MKKGHIISLFLLDIIIIWFWIKLIDPIPSQSLGIILVVPIAFIVNISVSFLFLLNKNKKMALLFFINSIICSILTAVIFSYQIKVPINHGQDYYTFTKNDSIFSIFIWKLRNEFDIEYNKCKNCSMRMIEGKCIQKKDTLFLVSDSNRFMILNDFLYEYYQEPIKLTKKHY